MLGCPTCFCKAFTMSASVTSPISWMYLWQNSRNTSMNAASNSWFVYLPFHHKIFMSFISYLIFLHVNDLSIIFTCMLKQNRYAGVSAGGCVKSMTFPV